MGLRKTASRAEPLLVDLSELGDSTRRVRQQAEAQAQVVRDRAAQEAQTLRDEAKTSGFDEGYAAGLQEGRAEGIRQAEAARADLGVALEVALGAHDRRRRVDAARLQGSHAGAARLHERRRDREAEG